MTQAPTLLAGPSATHAIMDKAYDADAVLDWLIRQAILPVIPPKAHRIVQRSRTAIFTKNVTSSRVASANRSRFAGSFLIR
ncbi:MAG: hypothetical protein IPL99_27065 [Candidatus Competibacteraceae bacterium]|nr:hypothetical protein [Candidatus Competibacteraceae bacterium]